MEREQLLLRVEESRGISWPALLFGTANRLIF